MAELVIVMAATAMLVMIPYFYWRSHREQEDESRLSLDKAVKNNMIEPNSLHPKIDPNRCISIGACLKVCPEGKILGLINGRAELVSPTKCIGHGACARACPVGAISLVFGTERRGVELPQVKETFETNVDGVYIAGELGGMGLIRNAITQGREAVEYIGETLTEKGKNGVHDIAIIGAGPAGFAATLQAIKDKLDFVTLEQEDDFGGTVLSYPRQKLVMTQEMEIPMFGKYKKREILKEDLLALWNEIADRYGVKYIGKQKVQSIARENGHFAISASGNQYKAQKVLLAIGRRGSPRKLGVKGEKSVKVSYKLLEPEQFKGKHSLVVGGGDSAVEAALALCKQDGARVTLSYRKDVFGRIKEMNAQRIEKAASNGWVDIKFESQVKEILADKVMLSYRGEDIELPNDFVFVFIGGELPTKFLKNIGVEMVMKHGVR